MLWLNENTCIATNNGVKFWNRAGEDMNFIETDDHNGLKSFYRENGLEVSDDLVRDDGAVFSIKYVENSQTISAATLSRRFEVYILDYVAVDPDHRKKGLGEMAVAKMLSKAKQLGAKKVYITSKSPVFFKKIGFLKGSPEGVDMNADCVGCPQFNNGCTKLPMYIKI